LVIGKGMMQLQQNPGDLHRRIVQEVGDHGFFAARAGSRITRRPEIPMRFKDIYQSNTMALLLTLARLGLTNLALLRQGHLQLDHQVKG
jgi:hypothetical protein